MKNPSFNRSLEGLSFLKAIIQEFQFHIRSKNFFSPAFISRLYGTSCREFRAQNPCAAIDLSLSQRYLDCCPLLGYASSDILLPIFSFLKTFNWKNPPAPAHADGRYRSLPLLIESVLFANTQQQLKILRVR